MELAHLKQEAAGRWLGIFEHFGVDVGNGKHMPCPVCGGTDRFRYTNFSGEGDYICNQHGHGDGIDLIQQVTGKQFPEIIKEISEIIGMVEMDEKKEQPKVDPGPALNKLWKASSKLTGSDPVSKYLHTRKILLTPDNVRFCPKCYESDTKKEYPAMVARVQNADGKPVCLHRTYLNGTGKAELKSPKKLMTPTEPLPGAAIRLFQPGGQFESDVIGVAEGIETAISAAQLNGIATWSCLSTSILAGFVPPEKIKRVVIFGDADTNYSGQKAAYILANKLYLAGLLVEVMIPPEIGTDWNDLAIKLSEGRE